MHQHRLTQCALPENMPMLLWLPTPRNTSRRNTKTARQEDALQSTQERPKNQDHTTNGRTHGNPQGYNTCKEAKWGSQLFIACVRPRGTQTLSLLGECAFANLFTVQCMQDATQGRLSRVLVPEAWATRKWNTRLAPFADLRPDSALIYRGWFSASGYADCRRSLRNLSRNLR